MRGKMRAGDSYLLSFGLLLTWSQQPGLELHSGAPSRSPHAWWGPHSWVIYYCLTRHFNRKLDWKWSIWDLTVYSDMGNWHYQLQFDLLSSTLLLRFHLKYVVFSSFTATTTATIDPGSSHQLLWLKKEPVTVLLDFILDSLQSSIQIILKMIIQRYRFESHYFPAHFLSMVFLFF